MHLENDHLNYSTYRNVDSPQPFNFVGQSQISKYLVVFLKLNFAMWQLWKRWNYLNPTHTFCMYKCLCYRIFITLTRLHNSTLVADIWQRWLMLCLYGLEVCVWGTQAAAVSTSIQWTICITNLLFHPGQTWSVVEGRHQRSATSVPDRLSCPLPSMRLSSFFPWYRHPAHHHHLSSLPLCS